MDEQQPLDLTKPLTISLVCDKEARRINSAKPMKSKRGLNIKPTWKVLVENRLVAGGQFSKMTFVYNNIVSTYNRMKALVPTEQ